MMNLKSITSLLVIAIVAHHNGFAQPSKPAAKRPNIVFILADDLGFGDVGVYGQQKTATPNMDALAKKGMRFTQFYAGTAVCAPSRASLLTGLHTGHTPVRGNLGMKPEGQFPLPDSSVTIAQVLQRNGYNTGAFGKWGLGFPGSTGVPTKKGFDLFEGYNCQTLAHNYYPDHLWNNNERIELPGNLTSDSVYSAEFIHQEAMKFLAKQSDKKPFFLFLPYTLPHAMLDVPHDSMYQVYVKLFNEKPLQQPADQKGEHPKVFEPYPHAAFATMVSLFDKYVGETVAAIKKMGLEDNTLIIVTSDNGPHREGGGDPDYFDGSGPFRGIKRDLYEGGIREPFIAAWKGKIKPGTINDQPAAFWDMFPTFEQVAGIPNKQAIDGISIVPTLVGGKQPQHKYYYWEFHENNGRQAVRLGDWKGVRLNVSTIKDSPIELYDLKTDPSEKNNIAKQHPDIVQKINQIMAEAHVPDANWPLLFDEVKK